MAVMVRYSLPQCPDLAATVAGQWSYGCVLACPRWHRKVDVSPLRIHSIIGNTVNVSLPRDGPRRL